MLADSSLFPKTLSQPTTRVSSKLQGEGKGEDYSPSQGKEQASLIVAEFAAPLCLTFVVSQVSSAANGRA